MSETAEVYRYWDQCKTDDAEHDGIREDIRRQCAEVLEMLLAKNAAYGNSALDPVRVFSRSDAAEQIRVRIDDKLSRLARGSNAGEDVVLDLIGYLILLRIAEERTSA